MRKFNRSQPGSRRGFLLGTSFLISILLVVGVGLSGDEVSSAQDSSADNEFSPAWLDRFADPPPAARPQPLFVWNGKVTRDRITEMLEQFAERGMGGVFVHPRPGLVTEYLSEEWFDLWEHSLSECRRLGLLCHIYDENSYPSGFAGGHVIAEHPDLAAQYLRYVLCKNPDQLPEGKVLACFRPPEEGESPGRLGENAWKEATSEHPVVAMVQCEVPPRGATAHMPYVDVTRPGTIEAFLESTHHQYARHFGDHFGDQIRYSFTDEPELVGRHGYQISEYFLEQFKKDHGYDLRPSLGDLCFETPESPQVRFDYFSTLHRLWIENFYRPYYQWCGEHGLAFTGHLWEHEWPVPAKQTSNMATLRWMQAPGNDLLGFQFYPTSLREQGVYFLNMKELSSIAHQLGCERVLCEANGGGGYEMAIRQFKPLEDFILTMGVNLNNPHLSHQTLAGSRKYDWPQTLSDHSPWWDGYRLQADHSSRANWALMQGTETNRVLVLHPDTTGWLRFVPANYPDGKVASLALESLRESQTQTLTALQGGQIDFDLGDEFTMEELGRSEDGKYHLGRATYEVIVIPPGMENWRSSTLQQVRAFLASGGHVYQCGEVPTRLDGRKSNSVAELAREFSENWHLTADLDNLFLALRRHVPPRICGRGGAKLPANLCWRRKVLDDGAILYFFCHPWETPFRGIVELEGHSLYQLDTARGEIRQVACKPTPTGQSAVLDLPALGHALWLALPEGRSLKTDPPLPKTTENVVVDLAAIECRDPNLLMLDYCDLKVGDQVFEEMNTVKADRRNWQLHGFDDNLWSRAIQYRRRFLHAPIENDHPFTVTYRFHVDPDAVEKIAESLAVAVERPWLYDVRCNDRPLDFPAADAWFDEDMRAAPLAEAVRAGENRLTLSAEHFHVLCELMPVYVLGDFFLEPAEKGFVVTSPRPLEYGRWDEQGRPFDPGKVAYEYGFSLEAPAEAIQVRLPDWNGSLATVLLDGETLGHIAWPPEELLRRHRLEAGDHRLTIVVTGNLKNMLGPHFSDGLPGIWTWANAPAKTPPGEKYRFFPAGLNTEPEVGIAPAP